MRLFSNYTLAGRQTNINMNMNMNNQQVMPFNTYKNSIIKQPHVKLEIPEEPVKKVKWGPPIWYLLHTLSVKIKEEHFMKLRVELLNNIYAICTNLPCPDCSNHAKIYLNSINFNAIQTKEDFKRFLFNFHNSVNKRKGYPEFSYQELNEKYSLAITKNVLQVFMIHFQDRNRSIKLLATDFHKTQLVIVLKKWFNDHIMYFDN